MFVSRVSVLAKDRQTRAETFRSDPESAEYRVCAGARQTAGPGTAAGIGASSPPASRPSYVAVATGEPMDGLILSQAGIFRPINSCAMTLHPATAFNDFLAEPLPTCYFLYSYQ
jgi:hypothetical protein